jgi:hypothetical protein
MLLSSKDLRHAVGWHVVSVNPLNVQAGLDLLSYPGLMDIDVLKLRVQLVLLLCRNTNSLLVVTPKGCLSHRFSGKVGGRCESRLVFGGVSSSPAHVTSRFL